jgi:hypothetical protein
MSYGAGAEAGLTTDNDAGCRVCIDREHALDGICADVVAAIGAARGRR